jgi:phosphohistidine phosphatase
MKKIFLLRHGKAIARDLLADIDRPLNSAGIEDAIEAGKYLSSINELPAFILCSSAKRTMETIQHVLEVSSCQAQIVYTPRLYRASSNDLLEEISQLSDRIHSVMIVGHNPTISNLCINLAKKTTGNVEKLEALGGGMKPASMVLFQAEIDDWTKISFRLADVMAVFTPQHS